jgi:hypothetical protein
MSLKEHCGLWGRLNGSKYDQKYQGWMELDNGFLFFTDKQMFNNFCTLYGVSHADGLSNNGELDKESSAEGLPKA